MSKAKYIFGDIVVVDGDQVGCVVKTWESPMGVSYEVYVRSGNRIYEYREEQVRRYVFSKELLEEQKFFV